MTTLARTWTTPIPATSTATITKVAAAWFVGLCLCLAGYLVEVSVVLNAAPEPGLPSRLGFYVAGAIMWTGVLLIVVFTAAAIVRAVRTLFAPPPVPTALRPSGTAPKPVISQTASGDARN